jgi:pimeloyl-ACP methyl ester carboxylesterase
MSTISLGYDDVGSGPAVVLLHAFPLDARMWAAQRTALSDTHRVITPDLRGFGRSPLGEDPPSLDAMADDVAALLDALALDRVALGGLSLGGYVAMAFVRRHARRVNALMLLDTKATADGDQARNNRERIAQTIVQERSPRVLHDDVLPGLTGATTKAQRPEVVGALKSLLNEAPHASVAWTQRAMAARPDSVPTLEEVEEPALIVVGDEDALAPLAEAEIMLDALPDAELAVIPGCGHLSAMERPDDVTAVLRDFLEEVV